MRDSVKELAEQQDKDTRLAAWQKRLTLDMILAEKGGVCKMIDGHCCIYISSNTSPKESHCLLEHKLGVIRTLYHRTQNVPTRTEGTEEEQKHIKRALKTCGYPGLYFIKSFRKPRGQREVLVKKKKI